MDDVNFLLEDLDDPDDITSATNVIMVAIIGACMDVHGQLGPGFVPAIYEEALAHELTLRDVSFVRQWPVAIAYKSKVVGEQRLGFLVEQKIVLDVKSCARLRPIHSAVMRSHLAAAKKQLGVIVNFNVKSLKRGVQRVVLQD